MILSVGDRLEDSGYSIGQRVTELIGMREHIVKRETRIVNMLQVQLNLQLNRIAILASILHMTLLSIIYQFVSNVVWRHLFNKTADNLERSMENEDECMILPCIVLTFSIEYLVRLQRCLMCSSDICAKWSDLYNFNFNFKNDCPCINNTILYQQFIIQT